ncbi:MAG: sterol desaturase family protein [Proteobacteria bacterium]|nr:sterol desaturase family protein [Pseudomonadota bacterium]
MIAIAALAGIATWSFLEYVIHRWAGHDRRLVKRTMFGVEHTRHHSEGDYFAPNWKKALMAIVIVPLITVPVGALLGWGIGLAYSLGFVGFYLTYEWLHRRLHVTAGTGPYAKWARMHHFHHHFHSPAVNHGVTSPIWDWVFGTLVWPEQIRVPERLAMRWLRDDEGEIRAEHREDYALRRSKRKAA